MALGLGVLASGACFALVDKNADQCTTSADCDAKGGDFRGRTCNADHVCVRSTTGTDSGIDADTATPDIGEIGVDAQDETLVVDAPDGETPLADTGDSNGGVFLVGGTTLSGGVLVAVDPMTGTELAREVMTVTAIAYDPGLPTGGGDVWYIFEDDASHTDAGGSGAKLHARTFDPSTRKYTELSTVAVPKPTGAGDIVVLNGRLIYMATYTGSDPLAVGNIFLLDVSNPKAVKQVCVLCTPTDGPANTVVKGSAAEAYLGFFVGGRAEDTLTGGTVGIGFKQGCSGAPSTCPVYFQRYRYTGNDGHDLSGNQLPFGSYSVDTTVGLGTSYRHKAALMVVPTSATKGAILENSQTFSTTTPDTVATFDYAGRATFSPVVMAGCQDIAIFTTFVGKLNAVPFTGGTLTPTSIEGGSASQMAFDTKTMVAAYVSNGLKAAHVTTSPTLTLTALPWPATDYVPSRIRGREPAKLCAK